MAWLEAMLAFAFSMFLFSTLVSGLLEIGQRVLGVREKGLRLMVERAFDELSDRLGLPRDGARREAFVGHMTANPVAPELRKLRMARKQLRALPVEDFLARLADTELGERIARRGDAKLDAILTDVARRYERIGRAASLYFRERAGAVTVVLAIGFAFAANVDGVRLFRTFLADDVLRASFVERAAKAEAADAQGVERVEEVRQKVRELSEAGVPIGWSLYPYAKEDGEAFGLTGYLSGFESSGLRLGLWTLSVLFTGLLIGLGGPFWYDLMVELGRLLSPGRGGSGAERGPARPEIRSALEPSDAKDAFLVARATRRLAPRGRRPLDHDGNPLAL